MEFVGFYKNEKTNEITPYPSWRDLFRWPDPKKIKLSFRLNPIQEIILTKEEFNQRGLNLEKDYYTIINSVKIIIILKGSENKVKLKKREFVNREFLGI